MTAALLEAAYRRKRGAVEPVPGRYLFPLDFVDLRQRVLHIRSLDELTDIKAVHQHTHGVYACTTLHFAFQGGQVEQFRVYSQAEAEERLRRLQHARAAVSEALRRQEVKTLQQLDVFYDVRTQGGFEALKLRPQEPPGPGARAEDVPRRLGRRWLTAAAVGLVLGGVTLLLRNLASDFVAFRAAQWDGRGEAFLKYAETGWRYVDEARRLGAEADFSGCERSDTEACWRMYLARWDGSPRFSEAKVERLPRAALRASSKTVSTLRDFRKRYPGSVVDGEARARIHALFAKSLAEFQNQASTRDAGIVPFVSKLLAHLEATDNPQVLLRFRQQSSPSLARADKVLGRAMREQGRRMASVSGHFEPRYTQPLEQAITEALGASFKQIFPTDLLTLESAPSGQRLASTYLPVLDIVYTIGWSGKAYRSEETGRVFVGIQFDFNADLSVPGQEPLRFRLRVTPPAHFTVEFTRMQLGLVGLAGDGPSDDSVYRVMALRAFDELSGKLAEVFFRSDSKAFQASSLGGAGTPPSRERDPPRPTASAPAP